MQIFQKQLRPSYRELLPSWRHLSWWLRASVTPILLSWILLIANAACQEAVILQYAELNESSGLAVSQHDSSLIWTHNDSGGKPILYLFNRSRGELRGLFQISDVKATDWEDMCAFSIGGRRYLAVGDIGDNQRRRKQVMIHVIEEPLPPPIALFQYENSNEPPAPQDASPVVLPVSPVFTFEVSYPDGAVDCESLVFDTQNSRFLLLTKELFRCRVFSVPVDGELFRKVALGTPPKKQVSQAIPVQTLGIPMATAADYCPQSQRLAVCTYGPAYLLEQEGLLWSQQTMKRIQLPNRRQGETIAFADPENLLVTSEFTPTPLWTVPVPMNSKEQ